MGDEINSSGMQSLVQSAIREAAKSLLVQALVFGGTPMLGLITLILRHVEASPIWISVFTDLFIFSLGIAVFLLSAIIRQAHNQGRLTSSQLFVALFAVSALGFIFVAYQLVELRSDLYALKGAALPRTISRKQSSLISEYLKQYPPHSMTLCTWNDSDEEAANFAYNIRKTLEDGGWTIDNCPERTHAMMQQMFSDEMKSSTSNVNQADLFRFFNSALAIEWIWNHPQENLYLQVQRSQQLNERLNKRKHPDPKNPDIEQLTRDALGCGDVELYGWGSGGLPEGATEDEIAILTIGPRSRTRPPEIVRKQAPPEGD